MGSDNDNDEDCEVESSVKDEHEVLHFMLNFQGLEKTNDLPFLFQLSIDSLALDSQGPTSPPSPDSCGFIPSISQVWSSPPPEFRDWHPTSQISQFLNDLNYVPMDPALPDVLEYHGKEGIERVEGGEQCKLEDLDEEFVHKVCVLFSVESVMRCSPLGLVRFLFLIPTLVKRSRMAQHHSHTHCRHRRPCSSIQATIESRRKLENVLERRPYNCRKKSIYSHLCGPVS